MNYILLGGSTTCRRESLEPPLVVSRESGAPADQVEETPGRASLEKLGCRTPPQLHAGGVGRQQQHAKESTTFYMEDEHEMSNILTIDNRTTTEMQVVRRRLQQYPGYGILAGTDDGQTH